MKEFLTNKINNLPASATLAMAAKARELKNSGIDIIGLSLGEPDFNVPDFIKNAAISSINQNYNSYTPVDGYADLKEAICQKFKRDNKLSYNANQIVVSTGAKQSIANVVQAMVKPGEEVILLAPFFRKNLNTLSSSESFVLNKFFLSDLSSSDAISFSGVLKFRFEFLQ